MHRVLTDTISQNYHTIFDYLHEKNFPRRIMVQLKQHPSSVSVNGRPVLLKTPLFIGDTLIISIMETKDSSDIVPVEMPLAIVFEDEDMIVIDKPARLPVHPSIRHYEDTLANGLMFYYKNASSPFVFRCINRLDRDTSGLTLIAKNPFSSAMLQRQVKDKSMKKTYLAIAEGELDAFGTIDAPIGRTSDSVILRQIDTANGQRAVTHYTCLQQKNGFSLASIELETGRTHQIRVHMSSIGHPLLGDFLYHPENGQMTRQALHSHRLTFSHPVTGEALSFVSPLPEDMKALLQ